MNLGWTIFLLLVISFGRVLSDSKKGNAEGLNTFRFTQEFYNGSVAENSMGSTMVTPTEKMGVWNRESRTRVEYRILAGDSHHLFRPEARQVGDFCFLILRVNNNERSLNREMKELYKLSIRAELHDEVRDEESLPVGSNLPPSSLRSEGENSNEIIDFGKEATGADTTPDTLKPMSLKREKGNGTRRGRGPKARGARRILRDDTGRRTGNKPRTKNRSGEKRKNRKEKDLIKSTFPIVPSTSTTSKPTTPKTTTTPPIQNGKALRVTDTTVFIRIIDLNDNVPVFENPTYDVAVNEDAPVLSKVAKITAADADIGRNREIYYSLSEWSDHWTIDPITGILSPVRPLVGRADGSRQKISVRARNRWNAGGGSSANVNILVRPVNRYAPHISTITPPQVEARPYGVIYSVVNVRDTDEGENGLVDLEIREGDPNGIFRITPTKTKNEFYVEMSPIIAQNMEWKANSGRGTFNLTLRATDRGIPSKSSEKDLEVRISDFLYDNSQSAVFDKDVYEVEISERAPPHSVVFRVGRPHPKVVLSISSGNDGDDFLLEPKSGVLYTAKWLDAEVKSTYTLTLDSHDTRPGRHLGSRRGQSVAKVVVRVKDENDSDPVFDLMPKELTLNENEGVGTRVAKISARDRDQGENGYVTYNIANLKAVPFSIDHFTGDLKTSQVLDYETSRRIYTLRVRASDWGTPSRRESEMILVVNLKDVNDNRPLFTVTNCRALLDRSIKFETEFGRLEAIDFDRGDSVAYRIVGGNEDGCFSLDSTTGKLRVMCDLRDFRAIKRFLNVTATDTEYYSDVMTIKIELSDGLRSIFNKSENLKSGLKLFSTSQSVFECQDTGVADRLARETQESHNNNEIDESELAESGFPPLLSRYGENVHGPSFIDFPNGITVNESSEVETVVFKIKAKDLDKGYNGLLTFVISGGDEIGGVWDIRGIEPNGEFQEAHLILAAPLDREEIPNYVLNISVWDQGKAPKHMSRLLPIKVLDSNDNPPRFAKSGMKIKFGEGDALVGETLLQVSATDADEEGSPNSAISFRLLSDFPEFTIDEKSGEVKLMKELDRERQDKYEILVMAEDNGSPKRLSSIAVLTLIVEDRNDNPPRFEALGPNSKSRVAKIREDWPVGGLVTRVFAKDDDLGSAGEVRYSLIDASSDFLLDDLSGVIRVGRKLNYERNSIYNLTIRARDLGAPSLYSDTFIVVEIFEVRDRSPLISFPDIVVMAKIPENSPVGSIVTSVSPTVSPDNKYPGVSLSLEGESKFLFTVSRDGVLRTANVLDRETKSSHWLTVVARTAFSYGPASDTSVAKMEAFIEVEGENDCVPLSVSPMYRTEVVENSPVGLLLLKIEAFDCDDDNQGFTFTLRGSNPHFTISSSGELRTSAVPLDREETEEHILEVLIFDTGTLPLNSTTKVTVSVRDENDNHPQFLFGSGVYLIPELGQDVQGDEPLDGDNFIETEEEEFEDGLKWSDWQVLPEEMMEDEGSGDGDEFEGIGWKKIFRIVGFDGDEGRNGTLTYRLKYQVNSNGGEGKGTDVFSIHRETGEIFTSATSIKGETILKFVIEASDGGFPMPLKAERELVLRAKGIRPRPAHHPPVLLTTQDAVSLTTKENPGYTVETIDAFDSDGDQIWYEIVSGDPQRNFFMNPDSQNLLLAKRISSRQEFTLNISLSDGHSIVYTKVLVRVIESEEISSLMWEEENYTAEIPELSPHSDPNHLVSRVGIKADNWTSGGGPILYGFHNAQDTRSLKLFTIDSVSGEVRVGKSGLIDRETISTHILTIKAKTLSLTDSQSFVRLTVNVLDSNDHAPMFLSGVDGGSPRIELRIPETIAVGTRIAQIEAFDMDSGENGRLSYSITFGNIGNAFGIEKETGGVYLNRPLNLPFGETSMEYQLTVKASDHGRPTSLTASASVNVIVSLASEEDSLGMRCLSEDEPHVGMKSGREMRVRMKENSSPGTYVTMVRVVNSASVSFEIEENRGNVFWIDPATGVILVGRSRGALDREKKPIHELTVRATNSRGLYGICRVKVELEDENDHAPYFTTLYYEGQISEDAPLGTLVMKREKNKNELSQPLVLSSTDGDIGTNALVTYSIIEANEMKTVFHIDPSTGALLLVTSLDYEKRKSYVLHVRAVDGGGLSSQNVAVVNVSVLNVNDKAPVAQNSRVDLLTPTAKGFLVHKVEVVDADGDELEFKITRGNVPGFFSIDQKSGEVRMAKTEGFTTGKHVVEVTVSDGRFSAVATVNIHVKGLEGNRKFGFRNSTFLTAAAENSTKVVNLLALSVFGAHMNENLKFRILSPTHYFGIKRTSGVLFTTGRKLDREEEPKHTLLVEAKGDEPSRIARCFVEITVTDINDNCPVYINLPYVAVVSVDAKPGDFVIQVKAFDADERENAIIRYELVRSPYGDIYELDKKTGEIRMRRKPDGVGHHEITIKAYDGGVPTCTTTAPVQIKIVTHDQPVFEQQWYETWIPEDAAVQSTALALVAHAKNPILYSIEAGNDFDEFGIDYQTGVLFVNSPLDFEAQSRHRLTLRATDLVSSSWSSTIVNVRIRDSNDNKPFFEKDSYTLSLPEGYMPPGGLVTVIKAHDNDTGINAMLTYELVPDESLEREGARKSRPERNLLLDIENEVEPELMLSEDATSNNRTRLSALKMFMVKPNDGSIVLKQTLDYERAHELRFSIIVRDSGIPPLSSTARVIVKVVDVNDNAPHFERTVYYARISEVVARGHFVAKVTAYDPDVMDSLRYAIVGHYHHRAAFEMDENSGIVILSQPKVLMSELSFTLNISVTDGVFTSFARLHIDVEPKNHHPPAFPLQIYEVGCSENSPDGTIIATLTAFDPDRSIFGKVKYLIADTDEPGLFLIDEASGEVRLSSTPEVSLDREYKGSHTIEIVAQDGGGWLGYTKLVVKVADVNEYSPVFPVSEYRVTIPSERLRSKKPILQVVAVDADTEFGIRYSILDLPPEKSWNWTTGVKRDAAYFDIHGETGELGFKMTDDEIRAIGGTRKDFQFWVKAMDDGGLHSHVPVTVAVLSAGEPTPEIQPQNSTFFVKEDAPVGSMVTTFRVTNIESPKFRLLSSNEFFEVDVEGNLIVNARLDQEQEDKHTVVIWAESGDGMSVATSQVTIRILDTNDEVPAFNSPQYNIKVAEDFPEGSLIFTVHAVDADKNGNVKERYSLVPSPDTAHFSVNQDHGWITLVNKLDYETTTSHTLHVVATDSEKPYLMSTATVVVEVLNVNDNPSLFGTGHYFSTVREDVAEGSLVATVVTTDMDQGAWRNNASTIVPTHLSYYIVAGNEKGHFKISERGEISMWRGLDAEVDQTFELTIVATDGFHTDYANLTVNISDVNDNVPICPIPEYYKVLQELAPIGHYVTTIEATDPDISAGRPVFSLSGHGSEHFEIDGESGVIVTKTGLDREGPFSSYTLLAHARDKEAKEECSSVIEIIIEDENDNLPKFTEEVYSVAVKEDAPIGALIGKVHADDADAGVNRRIRYKLTMTLANSETLIEDQFGMDSGSGVLSLLRPLDRELVSHYNLTIQATDGGDPPQTSLVAMHLLVLDVNDNPPEFAFNYYSSSISELSGVGTEVTRVLATSKDVGINAEISYDIVGGNGYNHFGIHPKTGVIFINGSLDYERVREYVLAVRARDGGTPPLAAQCLVNISVSDSNDNSPHFQMSTFSVEIPEDAAVSTSVIQITAADLDSGVNAVITYELKTGDRLKHFTIDPVKGIISVASALDREMIPHYSLEVWATDGGTPALSTSTLVQVQVLDRNDNAPFFSKENYSVIVQEDRPIGFQILTFDVSDADGPANSSPFTWDLRDLESPKGTQPLFTVSHGGTLNVAGKLNFQRKNAYNLQVRVFDNGDPPLYSDVNVTVKVVDKSQWPPVVSTLTVTAITSDETYPAGVPLGKVHASDFDPYDTLVYSLIETKISSLFTIDPSNGTLKCLTPLREGSYELGISVSDGRWTGRGDAYIRILTLNSLMPEVKVDSEEGSEKKVQGLKSRKDISSFAVVMTMKGHNPQSLLSRIFALMNAVKEAMGGEGSAYDVVVLSVQPSKSEKSSMVRAKREEELPSVDVLLAVRKSSDRSFISPADLVKKLRFALPQIESVLGAKVVRLTYDICGESSCDRGQCRTVATFEGTQSLITTETLSLITPNHYLETICLCPPGFGGPKCERVINACAHSECLQGFICVPDASAKGYACLCRKTYCSPDGHCEECSHQSVSFGGSSFLAYNVGPSLERELSLSVRVKTQYTSGTLFHTYGPFDYALLEIRQGLVQFSWDLGTGKEVLTVTSITVSNNKWHRILLQLRDNFAVLRVDERSTQKQKSQGPARGLHTDGHIFIGARMIGSSGGRIESLIPAQGFIGCMKDLRYGSYTENKSTDLHIQEVKHYITSGQNRVRTEVSDPNSDDDEDSFDSLSNDPKSNFHIRIPSLPLHSSDKDKSSSSHLINSRNISFSCEKFLQVVEACRSQPCLNGGTCHQDRTANGYRCDCPSRFHGLNCEIDLDSCGSSPCLNGGKCNPTTPAGISFSPSLVSVGESQDPQFYCQCVDGTFGVKCEKGRWCKNSDPAGESEVCNHRGECEEGPAGPICWCEKGYTGATCQLDINECERGDACGPGSTCLNFEGGFRCLCPANATGLRCNRILTTPSIVASDYQELFFILIIVLVFLLLLVIFIFLRRCLRAREREAASNTIPLTSHKDNKDNRIPLRDNRDMMRNRDSKISNLEVRPVSATSDIFATDMSPIKSYGSAADDLEKPPFINNLAKGSEKKRGTQGPASWESNRDDYPKKQNYMKGEINWVSKGSKPSSPVSTEASSGYHWDHSDLSHPANISPTRTLPPPPDIPDSLSLISHDSNTHEVPTINLAAFPPIDSARDMDTLVEDDGECPIQLPPLDEGTSCDDEHVWPIPHPDQYLLSHRVSEGTDTTDQEENGGFVDGKPIVIRNRYRRRSPVQSTSGGRICEISDDEINENCHLLGGPQVKVTTNGTKGRQPQTPNQRGNSNPPSPHKQFSSPNGSSHSSTFNGSNSSGVSFGGSAKKNFSKTTHITQV